MRRRVAAAASVVAAAALLGACGSAAARTGPIGPWDWPTYGHDAQHSFHGRTTLTATQAAQLKTAWFFPTKDAVTATPTVVNGTVYAGSWDGWFYAVGLRSGTLRWKFRLRRQPAVTPFPGEVPRDISSDGGIVTSSAWYEPASENRPDMVIFGGGYTLYGLDADNGQLIWAHDYPGRPGAPPDPATDDTRIFSSPVVVGDKVIFGVDVDGRHGKRGYIAAASLANGKPVWEFQTDVGGHGQVLNDGCGSVWSSGTVLPKEHLVVFDVADCRFSNPPPLAETVLALHVNTGKLAWTYRPGRQDGRCDQDFGATVNGGLDRQGNADFLGVGGKDGTYYVLNPANGHLRWKTNVVFGGFAGGFIATTAYDGAHVVGATALGDFGRFEGNHEVFCDPGNPLDLPRQEPSDHAFDAKTGKVIWQVSNAFSFAPTTIAGPFTFNCPGFGGVVTVRRVSDGTVVAQPTLPADCWAGVATVGDALILGTGTSTKGQPAGLVALTPNGSRPKVPSTR